MAWMTLGLGPIEAGFGPADKGGWIAVKVSTTLGARAMGNEIVV